MADLKEKVLAYIGAHSLLAAGDRVAVAVSGGPDSVALLRLLLELRPELGIVLSVAHFNHKIRGVDSDIDEKFVAALAARHGLELHTGCGDTPAHARRNKQGLEAAARQLRYKFFRGLSESRRISSIATGHTLDDQAETVLMRLIRGAGTKGTAGIYPIYREGNNDARAHANAHAIIRPLLNLRRHDIESYLRGLGQPWREDASNSDRQHLRNRIRHELLPLLEKEFNPSMTRVLADTAEIARAEEDYWRELADKSFPGWSAEGAHSFPVALLRNLPLALQRRGLRAMAERAGVTLDFEHVEELRRLALAKPTLKPKKMALPHAQAELILVGGSGELRLRRRSPTKDDDEQRATAYEYRLPAPGEVQIRETGSLIRARMVPATALAEATGDAEGKRYNRAQLFDPSRLAAELTVRNWRAGDRYWPGRGKSPRKVKELLQRVPRKQRELWPVVLSGSEIVWMRGFPPSSRFTLPLASEGAGPGSAALLIEEVGKGET